MFEKALIRRADDRAIDVGTLAETMLFYGKTQLLLSRGVINVLTTMPCDVLLDLISRGCLNLSYVKPTFGVLSTGLIRVHNFAAFEHGPKGRKRISTYQEEIADAFVAAYGNSRATRNATNRFIDRVRPFHHKDFNSKTNIVCDLTRKDIVDPRFVLESARTIIQRVAPSYPLPAKFQFDVVDVGEGYVVLTDLDFSSITKACAAPFNESFTPAHLLGFIQDARADTFFASHYMAELVTTELASEIIRHKHYDWLQRGDSSRKEIDLFQEIVSDKVPSIRESITSGSRSMAEFIKLLDQADKFKSWLQATNPDQGLVNAYLAEATKGSWADKLRTKIIRIAVLNIAGLGVEALFPTGLAIGASVALSAADTLLLDPIAKGWRPAHFINGPYKAFVSPNGR